MQERAGGGREGAGWSGENRPCRADDQRHYKISDFKPRIKVTTYPEHISCTALNVPFSSYLRR